MNIKNHITLFTRSMSLNWSYHIQSYPMTFPLRMDEWVTLHSIVHLQWLQNKRFEGTWATWRWCLVYKTCAAVVFHLRQLILQNLAKFTLRLMELYISISTVPSRSVSPVILINIIVLPIFTHPTRLHWPIRRRTHPPFIYTLHSFWSFSY